MGSTHARIDEHLASLVTRRRYWRPLPVSGLSREFFSGGLRLPPVPLSLPLAEPLLVPDPPDVRLSSVVPMLSPVPVAPPVLPIPSQRGLSLLLPLVPVASSGPEAPPLPLVPLSPELPLMSVAPLVVAAPSLGPETPDVSDAPALPVDLVGAVPEGESAVPVPRTARSVAGAGTACVPVLPDEAPDVPSTGSETRSEGEVDWANETGPALISDRKTAVEIFFILAPEIWNAAFPQSVHIRH